MVNNAVEFEEIEDLAEGLVGGNELDQIDLDGFIFQDLTNRISPGRRMTTIYSLIDGEPIPVMRYRVREWLQKRQRNNDGSVQRMFTMRKEDAPVYTKGSLRCFLAADSQERLSGALAEAGLGGRPPCAYSHGTSEYARDDHAAKKHRAEWRQWKEHQYRMEQRERDERNQKQVDAMLAIAGRAAGVSDSVAKSTVSVSSPTLSCDCGYTTSPASKNPAASLRMHQKHHKDG